jgi:uroporphyrinogen-III synthase
MTLTVLVTRPAPQAAAWVEKLRARGLQAQALPLIAIEPMAETPVLRDAWHLLPQRDLAMFVSPNAVTSFFAARPAARTWPKALRAAATGPGTVEALVAAGVPEALCVAPRAAPFDSSALWAELQNEDWVGRNALVVRGDGGRDEFAQALRSAGAKIAFVQAYQRRAPDWSEAERALALAAIDAPGQHVWLLSSAEAIDHLLAIVNTLRPGTEWKQSIAVASHPRIAQRARRAGFGRVLEAPPVVDAVLSAIGSLGDL